RVSSAASRLPGTTSLRFALHGWQRLQNVKTPSRTVKNPDKPEVVGDVLRAPPL
ncbi:MAG: hypothetical protein JMN26_15205, partial [gamma proteobacterium endosymbiont of Lamellibrachia anaximandri]|nr:hypothetical protein [gamma proteobacterium endosymbiont of Lamellibrachia anaximandri]